MLLSFPTTELWAIVRSPTWCLPPSKRQTGRPNQIPRPSLSTSVANWHLWKPRSQAPGGAERREASWRNIHVLGKTWTISQWPSNWIGPEELLRQKMYYCIPSKSGIIWQDSKQSTASSKHAESSLVASNFVTLSPHGSNLCSNLMLKNVIARELKRGAKRVTDPAELGRVAWIRNDGFRLSFLPTNIWAYDLCLISKSRSSTLFQTWNREHSCLVEKWVWVLRNQSWATGQEEILQMWFGSNAHVSMCAVHPLEPQKTGEVSCVRKLDRRFSRKSDKVETNSIVSHGSIESEKNVRLIETIWKDMKWF